MSYLYKGRHRKPTATGRKVAAVATAAAIPLATAGTAYAGPDGGWDSVIACESGGDPRAQNATSTASGLYQFINGTWAGYGGLEFAPTAKQATPAEQTIIAERAYAAEGLTPWASSKGCWAGKTITIKPKPSTTTARSAAAQAATGTVTNLRAVVVPKDARYTPGGDGEYTVQPGDSLVSIAKAHNTGFDRIAEKNPTIVEHDQWIFPGERLHL